MIEYITNPFQRAVAAAIGFPTIENLLCEGHTVSLQNLKDNVGSRLVIPKRSLCMSHVRSLATSILKHGSILLPIILERKDDKYVVKDGFHRLAALDLIKDTHPEVIITVKVKLYNLK